MRNKRIQFTLTEENYQELRKRNIKKGNSRKTTIILTPENEQRIRKIAKKKGDSSNFINKALREYLIITNALRNYPSKEGQQ